MLDPECLWTHKPVAGAVTNRTKTISRTFLALRIALVQVRVYTSAGTFGALAVCPACGASLAHHPATSSTDSSFAERIDRSLSATKPTAVSIAVRVVSSVQHHSEAFPNSG